MKKWLYPLLIAFVAFLIFSSPTRAGTETRTFVIWIGDLAEAAGDFLDGLFTEEAEAETPELLQPNSNEIELVPGADVDDATPTPTTAGVPVDPGDGDSSDGFGPPGGG